MKLLRVSEVGKVNLKSKSITKCLFSGLVWLFLLMHLQLHATNEIVESKANPPAISREEEDTIASYFAHQKNYIPGTPLNQAIKTIGIVFNIWQRDDGSGNLIDTEINNHWFGRLSELLSLIYSSSAEPRFPIPGVQYLKDSHIRFEMKGAFFHQNTPLHRVSCYGGKEHNNYVFQRYPLNRQYLNIHLVTGSCGGASGYTIGPTGRNIQEDQYIVSFIRELPPGEEYPFWGLLIHLAHEIGHILDLDHPYNSEHCKFSHPDFLFDLFGFETQEWCKNRRSNCDICFQQGDWDCDLTDPSTTCTNNLMGGNKGASSITPLQMGRMNRTLALKNARKYAWGYSTQPYLVESSQTWEFNKKFYQDIRLSKGTTLTLKGTIEMVPQASIFLEPGSVLVVDGGNISPALYSSQPWKGVFPEAELRKWYWLFKKKVPPGKVLLVNNGVINF